MQEVHCYMISKEVVKRAVEMKNPPRIPVLYLNKFIERSDILSCGYGEAADFPYRGTKKSEWGFEWQRLDDTMGQPKLHPLTSWDILDHYHVPDPHALGRFDHLQAFMDQNSDKYLMGSIGISGFNFITFLRGFENIMMDLVLEKEKLDRLMAIVFGFEEEMIRSFGKYQLDAISFGDDWGTQRSLMISPDMWREVFKPRYKQQFDLVHQQGMHVYFHCCGYINDIIPDLIEIGVDILNLNQPDLLGVEDLGERYRGKVCFNCPVDHQTVAIHGNREEIFQYVKKMKDHLSSPEGGFIGYIEEYHSVGMSDENFHSIIDAFETYK